jgi:hypothetical protein
VWVKDFNHVNFFLCVENDKMAEVQTHQVLPRNVLVVKICIRGNFADIIGLSNQSTDFMVVYLEV